MSEMLKARQNVMRAMFAAAELLRAGTVEWLRLPDGSASTWRDVIAKVGEVRRILDSIEELAEAMAETLESK